MSAPRISVEAPSTWAAADLARPPLSESSGATWSEWKAWRSPAKDATLVTGCYAAPVPGWVDDMQPAFTARAVSLAGATAAKITGFAVETFPDGEVLGLRAAGGGPTVGFTQSFLGFSGSTAHSCFVVCAGPNAAPSACNEVVVQARLVGGDVPPPPGLALGAVTWAVHHPSTTATTFAVVTLLAAVLAIATRRKPRARA